MAFCVVRPQDWIVPVLAETENPIVPSKLDSGSDDGLPERGVGQVEGEEFIWVI